MGICLHNNRNILINSNKMYLKWIVLWRIINVNCFILLKTNNMLKYTTDYKINLIIDAEDYENTATDQLKELEIKGDSNLNKLEKIAEIEYNNTLVNRSISLNTLRDTGLNVPIMIVMPNETVKLVKTLTTIEYKSKLTKATEQYYDYKKFISEYIEEMSNSSHLNGTFQINSGFPEYGLLNSIKRVVSIQTDNYNCTNLGVGLHAIKCLVKDYKSQRHFTLAAAKQLWRIIKIWFLIYLIIAVPLWCTRGWCCCCLFCKFFKPQQTIEEAKKYIALNPPGVYKTKTGVIQYEPTTRERETYEEFEHFIKIL